ncbi:FadR family transcriptional regulator [Alkalihalobacillus oceani]|uniref:FadR/GntR family transcriptional regulator n=1 Tax=Halalkalibacter oceani TaxID=1653776 RepID=UPI002040A51A|nr:FadR/GntR family transcriptional regulator [Halalkalibacter oceani]MCM3760603.1 FadR family transcriptional regulator [Halalkalibacter oceani]
MIVEIKTSTAAQEVTKQILRLIKEGKLKKGDKLPNEMELMKKLNVGRSTVREAKQILITRNFLEVSPGRGTYIKEIDFDSILDEDVLEALFQDNNVLSSVYETRDILETETAIRAAKRATEKDLNNIYNSLKMMKNAKDKEELFHRGQTFHMSIAKASQNPVLIRFYYIILKLLQNNQLPNYKVNIAKEIEIHENIFEAIKSKDISKTKEAIRNHFDYVIENSNDINLDFEEDN